MLREIKKIRCLPVRSAFTLVELMAVAGMIAMMTLAVAGVVVSGHQKWEFSSDRSIVLQDGFAGMSQMSRLLRQSKGVVSVSDPADEAGYITFAVGANGNFMRLELNTVTSELEYGQLGSTSPLVGPVTRLVFKCYDAGDNLIVDLTRTDLILSIVIEATFADEDDPSIIFPLSGRIFCCKDFQPVVINEIMYNPPGEVENKYEWVELYNFSQRPIDLTGWEIWTMNYKRSDLLIPHPTFGNGSMIIPAGGFAIITTSNSLVTGVDIDAIWLSCGDKRIGAGLPNNSTVAITNSSGQVDSVVYFAAWGGRNDGRTLMRIDPYYGNSDDPTNWNSLVMGGTPGGPN